MTKTIYLSGFMASGKSAIGRLVAQSLKKKFIDLDSLIEKTTGLSVSDFFKQKGEKEFRALESSLLLNQSHTPHQVISLGGGTPLSFQNRLVLSRGIWINLNVPWPIILKRIATSTKRPLAAKLDEQGLWALYQQRSPFYRQAPFQIDCTSLSPKAIAQIILHLVKHYA